MVVLKTANLVRISRESAPCFRGGDGGDGREAREQRSAQGWQQGAGRVRFVESSEASPVIPVGIIDFLILILRSLR